MNSINWPAPNVWVFITQLVEHCSANAEAMGSNLFEALKTFFGLTLRLLNIAIINAMITSSFQSVSTASKINCNIVDALLVSLFYLMGMLRVSQVSYHAMVKATPSRFQSAICYLQYTVPVHSFR